MTAKSIVLGTARLIGAVLLCGAAAAQAADRPNILLAISDDQSWIHAGAYGCPGLKTPAFDRVAQQGILFHNAFSAGPMCTVSRACLLTGRNMWQNREAGSHWSNFPRDLAVYPYLLQDAGYAIGVTGKGWGPGDWKETGWPTNPAGPEFNRKKCTPPASGIHKEDYAANFRDFLEQKDPSKPFCFWFGCSEPHGPWEKGSGVRLGMRPEEFQLPPFMEDTPENRSNLADMFVEIEWFDKHLGQMLDLLAERGELDNTLIVVTGDNGSSIPHAKGNLYEYGVHVPLAVMWPRKITPGRTVDDLVSFIDLGPTFLEAAGLSPPDSMSGRSIMSILTSKQSGHIDPTRDCVYLGQERSSHVRYDHLGYPMRAIRTPQYLYIMNLKPDRWPVGDPAYMFRGKGAAAAAGEIDENKLSPDARKRSPEQLFDIQADQACLNDLAADAAHEEVREKLRAQLTETLTRQGDPRFNGYGDIWESYPRYGAMRPELGGFVERGKYNPKYQVKPPE
ncbi:MAG: sulfatase [Planctomycetota bacterium]